VPTRLSRRLLPAMLFRMTGKIWDLFLLFVGLGLGALGIVNSSTSLTWLVLAGLSLLVLLVHRFYLALAAHRDGRSSATQVALDFEGVQIGHIEIHEPARPASQEAQDRRRDEQIGSAPILKVGKPSFTYGSREMTLEVENASPSMAFSPSLRLRASRQLVGPPNWEPSTAATELLLSLPDAIAPGDRATFRGVLNDFVDMAKIPEIPLWPSQIFCDITMNGILGQRVLQRYEWVPAGRDGHYFWQRIVEVTPTDGVPVRLGS